MQNTHDLLVGTIDRYTSLYAFLLILKAKHEFGYFETGLLLI